MIIGERGQVTIPKHIRERFGLLPNVEVEFVAEDAGVFIRKKTLHISPVENVYGILQKNEQTDAYIELIRGR
jgi:AbrB family looped-hinge helix DNA binding protein